MANVVVVGAQWGDEGKGKIVDWLSKRADLIVRYQGGHNAGHTLVIDGETFKLSLLPSGVVRQDKISIIGNGVVIDPWALLKEIESISARGVKITPDVLKISESAALILPLHRELDELREDSQSHSIGTTRRGIGPAYEDKVGRRAVRVCDLSDKKALESQIDKLLNHHNALRKGNDVAKIDRISLIQSLEEIAPKIIPYTAPVWHELNKARKKGLRILFEGAQGAMLDVDHGTYPFVTSSNTLAGNAAVGAGIGPSALEFVLGICKAYTTRVGSGPFPTELNDEIGKRLGERGKEFGTVTGRPRRCGWFDATMVRQSVLIGGITGIALTKLDVLDGIDKLLICTSYELDGKRLDYLPAGSRKQSSITPIYEEMDGWKESTRGARSWNELPAAAVKYVRRIEELIEAPVTLLSTSPEREDTILVKDPFED